MFNILEFKPITLFDKSVVTKFLDASKSNSCQMNFANLYCQASEYYTEIAVSGSILYIRQRRRRLPGRFKDMTAYFVPIGAKNLTSPITSILETARAEKQTPYFFAVTDETKKLLEAVNRYRFKFTEPEDWAEYMYKSESFRDFSSSALSKQRRAVNRFLNLYGDEVSVERISEKNIESVIKFQKNWLEQNVERNMNGASLYAENNSVLKALKYFDRLELEGIVVKVGRAVRGYAYGNILPGGAFDIIAQKGDVAYQQIYKYILREHVRTFCDRAELTNMEEDIGLMGLRRSKTRYKPIFMLKKYTAEFI